MRLLFRLLESLMARLTSSTQRVISHLFNWGSIWYDGASCAGFQLQSHLFSEGRWETSMLASMSIKLTKKKLCSDIMRRAGGVV